jgi:hypothetical protein
MDGETEAGDLTDKPKATFPEQLCTAPALLWPHVQNTGDIS